MLPAERGTTRPASTPPLSGSRPFHPRSPQGTGSSPEIRQAGTCGDLVEPSDKVNKAQDDNGVFFTCHRGLDSSLIPFPTTGPRWEKTRFLKRYAWRVRKYEQFLVGTKTILKGPGRVFPSPSGQTLPQPRLSRYVSMASAVGAILLRDMELEVDTAIFSCLCLKVAALQHVLPRCHSTTFDLPCP